MLILAALLATASSGCSGGEPTLSVAGVTINGVPLDATRAGVSFVDPEAQALTVGWAPICGICGAGIHPSLNSDDVGTAVGATVLACRGAGQSAYQLALTRHVAPGALGVDVVELTTAGTTERAVDAKFESEGWRSDTLYSIRIAVTAAHSQGSVAGSNTTLQ